MVYFSFKRTSLSISVPNTQYLSSFLSHSDSDSDSLSFIHLP